MAPCLGCSPRATRGSRRGTLPQPVRASGPRRQILLISRYAAVQSTASFAADLGPFVLLLILVSLTCRIAVEVLRASVQTAGLSFDVVGVLVGVALVCGVIEFAHASVLPAGVRFQPEPAYAPGSLGRRWRASSWQPTRRFPAASCRGPIRWARTPRVSSVAYKSSPASSSRARCGGCAPAARACTSSCATPAVRCRARCG